MLAPDAARTRKEKAKKTGRCRIIIGGADLYDHSSWEAEGARWSQPGLLSLGCAFSSSSFFVSGLGSILSW